MEIFRETKKICKDNKIKPARGRGQNFLIKEEIYNKIIKTADLKKDDIVLEVGPGLGFLTERLAREVKKVIAVEIDKKLAEVLRIKLEKERIGNVEVVNKDILKIASNSFELFSDSSAVEQDGSTAPLRSDYGAVVGEQGELGRGYKIVANLPYNITSIFLRKFLSEGGVCGEKRVRAASRRVRCMVLMLQKEVAERIVAKQGKMSLLAVSVQFYSLPKIIQVVPADCFWPKPKVDSAIIHLTPYPPLLAKERGREKEFFRLVKIGFSAKRKMLKNNLAAGLQISQKEAEKRLKKTGFSLKIRAEELSVKEWGKLLGFFQ